MIHGNFRWGAAGISSLLPSVAAGDFSFRPHFLIHFALTLGVGISVLCDGCHPYQAMRLNGFCGQPAADCSQPAWTTCHTVRGPAARRSNP